MNMKKLSVLLCVTLGLVACKKDSKVSDIVNPTASFTCKINGTSWSAVTRVTRRQGNTFVISGTGSLGKDVLSITTLGITAKTYTLDPINSQTEFSATFTMDTNTSDSLYQAMNGTVVLTAVDTVNKKISGTFNFSLRKASISPLIKQVSNGSFSNLIYTE
jgi:D-arabinose 1-dehydrogenase-like Zn-dependent alcohol dehydrogenase